MLVTFKLSLNEKAHQVIQEGREYLVAPVVASVGGVMNGEWARAESFKATIADWEGMPITINHPEDEEGPISAFSEGVVHVGFLSSPSMNGKFKADAWFDVEALEEAGEEGRQVLTNLEAGEMMEVSTGYFRDLEPKKGVYRGRVYFGVQHNIQPDHLAVLPNDVGACSVEDGCGIPRANLAVNVLSKARRPSYEGTEKVPWANVSKTFRAYRDGYYKHSGAEKPDDVPATIADAPAAMKRWIASKSLLGEAGADDFRDLLFFPVVNPSTNKLNLGACRAVLGGRAAQANISEAAKESAQAMARNLIEKEFKPEGNVYRTIVINEELSLDEQMSRVYDAWYAYVKTAPPVPAKAEGTLWVREVFDDHVIVSGHPDGLLSYPYTVDDAGAIVFGDPMRVEIIYQPVEMATNKETLTWLQKIWSKLDRRSDAMDRDETIKTILANAQNKFPKAALQKLGDDELEQVAAGLATNAEPNEPEPVPTPAPAADPALAAIQESLTALTTKVDGLATNQKTTEDAEKAKLVAELVANEACLLPEDVLQAMSLDALRKAHNAYQPTDYSGRGLVRFHSPRVESIEAPIMPMNGKGE